MALLVGTIKAPTAALLLLTLVVAAAAVSPSSEAGDQPAAGGATKRDSGRRHGGHHSSHDGGRHSPLRGLTQCVTTCGTQVTSCFLECYKPVVSSADPVVLPLCLLNCTNSAMICANTCSSNII